MAFDASKGAQFIDFSKIKDEVEDISKDVEKAKGININTNIVPTGFRYGIRGIIKHSYDQKTNTLVYTVLWENNEVTAEPCWNLDNCEQVLLNYLNCLTNKIGIIYARVSSSQQSKYNIGHTSLEVQVNECLNECSKRGIPVGMIIREIGSASKIKYKSHLQKIVDNIKSNCVLVVYDVTRFSRNTLKGLEMVKKIDDVGASILTVADKFDCKDFASRHNFKIALCTAERDADIIREKVMGSINFRKARGDFMGKPPYGWKVIRNSKGVRVLERNPDEQKVIKLAKGIPRTNVAIRNLVNSLNMSGSKKRNRIWKPSMIRELFNN